MPDAIDLYLNRVMRRSRLSPPDARQVRSELKEHLCQLAADHDINPQNTKETIAMFEQEFGDPEELGASIARSKGRFRAYLKRKMRRLPMKIAIAIILIMEIEEPSPRRSPSRGTAFRRS